MLTLGLAQNITDAALAEAARLKLAPLAVAVLDAGGNLVSFARQDGAGIARFDIAFAKAWGSLGMGFGSRELTERARTNPVFITSLAALTGGRMAPSPGGVLIFDAGRRLAGAIGISGDTGVNDELAAMAGLHAAGLTGAPGLPG